jgi:hypothetical protein
MKELYAMEPSPQSQKKILRVLLLLLSPNKSCHSIFCKMLLLLLCYLY